MDKSGILLRETKSLLKTAHNITTRTNCVEAKIDNNQNIK